MVMTSIEGIELNTCQECSQFGTVLTKPVESGTAKQQPKQVAKQQRPFPVEEPVTQVIVADYALLIKKSREARGLTQEEFAKKINEKISLVHNLESGRFKPSIELARKLEHFLRIRLIEEYDEKKDHSAKRRDDGLTIGDVIQFK